MDTMKDKSYAKFDYLSRYSTTPYYYDELTGKYVFGIGTNMKRVTSFVSHHVQNEDTLDSLALKYYNNPTYWWIIAYYNNIPDAFINLAERYKVLQIPNISSISFGEYN